MDGLRGIAAIFVLMHHTSSFWGFSFPKGYLAVDLFFILSGFVIGHAYDAKLQRRDISLLKFFRLRLIRLYPIYLLSIFVCLVTIILGALPHLPSPDGKAAFIEIAAVTASTLFFIPFHASGTTILFPMNAPYWSLFFELISNFIYATCRPILGNKVLISIVGSAAIGIILIVNHFGYLNSGHSWDKFVIAGGIFRSSFGFFIGLFLYRNHTKLGRHCKSRFLPWASLIIVAMILGAPSFREYKGIDDLIAVFIIFPFVVTVAAHGKTIRFDRPLIALGAASYPIYLLHAPVSHLIEHEMGATVIASAPASGIALLLGLVVSAFLIDKYYDIPVRQWLSGRRDRQIVLSPCTSSVNQSTVQ
ncbi:acyltransferase family protein [Noviherbaspirillum suwonense]|uniref:acyltransferase family protein n=1 Tax=Noviherbaspirillum suwonense TaxID=1224511 RepID=UPI0024B6FDA4|nr:acyltransferase [Noviherbaspirillum suwonense]